MLENRVKRVMREGGMALCGHVGPFTGPNIVELVGRAGFDGVRIDLEHNPLDLLDIQMKVLAAERVGITPIVRVPGFDPAFILRLLDLGVQGITVPHISGPAQARAAVEAVRYPPLGDRGMGLSTRAADYGTVPVLRHIEESNREILLLVLIEDLEALDQIDAIAATEGIDVICVGPSDLGRALGVVGQPNHPKLVAAIGRVAEAVKKHGKFLSLSLGHKLFPRTMAELRELGVQYVNCGPEPQVHLLRTWSEQVQGIRSQLNAAT